MAHSFAPETATSTPIHLIASDALDQIAGIAGAKAAAVASAQGFSGALGETCLIFEDDGALSSVLGGMGTASQRARGRFHAAAIRAKLPTGTYRFASGLDTPQAAAEAATGWLLDSYKFTRYAGSPANKVLLLAPDGIDAPRIEAIAAGEALTRDLINTPANDMGPDDLEDAARSLAGQFGATIEVTTGDALLSANHPMIHAVGRAAARAPRLIDMSWGNEGPSLTLVGKGVCFDTGGLNIKPGASMGLMKKDMGGAATVLGLAHMIMALGLKLRLRVLIPAVENAISGDAFRPGDILTSRKGLTVEINNTDAEGRLVLADALALADEGKPDLIISMATLTGAARVAVGPDLSPFYATEDKDAAAVASGADAVADPVWRMPFWDPYEALIEPGIADLDNAPKGGFAGSITAALFLRRFVTDCPRYMHFDIFGWNPTAAPGRPKGGVGMGARALLEALPDMLNMQAD